MTLSRMFKIISLYAKASQMISWEHRFGYFFRIFRIFADIGITLFFISVYFSRTVAIGEWTKAEAFLVYAIYLILSSIHDFLFGDSFNSLSFEIRKGRLDTLLVKPVNSLFLVSFRQIYPSNVYRVIISIVILYYALQRVTISADPMLILYSVILMFFGLVIFYSIVVILATTSFWTFRGEVVVLLETLFSISKYPLDIFSKGIVRVFIIIPIIFIVTVPTRVLLEKPTHLHYFLIPIAIALYIISRKFWSLALKHYSSASS